MKSCCWLSFLLVGAVAAVWGEELPPIPRRIPPPGIELSQSARQNLAAGLDRVKSQLAGIRHPLTADIEIYSKAVDFALRHNEFYNEAEVARAETALTTANQRLAQLRSGTTPWTTQRGLVVRGYYSSIDGSPLPYGLEIPDQLDLTRSVPLYVWLHGRGDTATDLHFIHTRGTRAGQIAPAGAVVLHPFGRHCLGFKSAGEIDVLEAVRHAQTQYPIDPRRIVLMGFSMGGAGTWHLGAHYPDHWVAMSPGAGFAETAEYNRLTPDKYPPSYERQLWGLYDVPCYARNLLNLPLIAYSGENDRQIQAALVMQRALAEHGHELTHIIGPGMGHRYHPDSLAEILRRLDDAVQRGLVETPPKVTLQTRTLRYHKVHWVRVLGLDRHWLDSRVDAEITGRKSIRLFTRNVQRLNLNPWPEMAGTVLAIDGQTVEVPGQPSLPDGLVVQHDGGRWRPADLTQQGQTFAKRPGLQGPIDDAFMGPLLVVAPTGTPRSTQVGTWVAAELQHLQDRWRALFRGELPVKNDNEVTDEDIRDRNVIVWGDPESNRILAKTLAAGLSPPLVWSAETLQIGARKYDAARHVPVLIYPNPLNPNRYVVINSGPTFREAHDRTNSLQNPKLPDWAVLDITQPPDEDSAGRVAAAGFFDERWQLREE